MKKKYIVATRPSLLAYTQTEQTVNLLREKNPDCEYEIVKFSTQGDKVSDKPLTEFGGTGVFVKELENAIMQGKADFAIHSLKDVPGLQPEGLVLASYPKREDPRDVLLIKDNRFLEQLNDNCTIGTGSPRRIVQLAMLKPNAQFKDLRGNIDTRLRKLDEGEYDAIMLAAAGLKRLGKSIDETAYLSVETCLPAIGQGTIALECKSDDTEAIDMLRSINDLATEQATIAERGFMVTIGGGCKFPLASYATVDNGEITLAVMLGNHFTHKMIRLKEKSAIDKAEQLGIGLAKRIMAEAEKLGISF
jgi:hydroxymethylbilane synthase